MSNAAISILPARDAERLNDELFHRIDLAVDTLERLQGLATALNNGAARLFTRDEVVGLLTLTAAMADRAIKELRDEAI